MVPTMNFYNDSSRINKQKKKVNYCTSQNKDLNNGLTACTLLYTLRSEPQQKVD